MFKLVTVEDTVVVPARLFGHGRTQVLEHVINKQMSDRVIPGVGLIIALWDLLSIGEDRLVRNSGKSTTDCRFRILVFSPFPGEAIFSRVGLSTDAGILTYLGFFNHVWVPKDQLPRPSCCEVDDTYPEADSSRVWVWRPKFDGENEMAYYMDLSTEAVVRVTSIEYDDRPPSGHNTGECRMSNVMIVKASLYDDVSDDNQGLGDPRWWYEDPEEADVNEEDQDQNGEDLNENCFDPGTEMMEQEYGNDGNEYNVTNTREWEEEGVGLADELVHEDGGGDMVEQEDD